MNKRNSKTNMAKRYGSISCLRVLFYLIVLSFLNGITMAQELSSTQQAVPVVKSQIEKEIELANQRKVLAETQKAEAEALRAVAEAKKAEAALRLPSTSTKGLQGDVTVEAGAGYYAEILAYESLNECARQIALELKDKLNPQGDSLIILGQTDLGEEAALWDLLKIKIDAVNEILRNSIKAYSDYDISKKESVIGLGVLAAASPILGAAADIAAFFKVDRSLTNRAVTINRQALFSAVANEIQDKSSALTIILPECNLASEGEIHKGIKEIMENRIRLLEIKNSLNANFDTIPDEDAEKLIRSKAKKEVLNKTIDKAIADGKSTAELEEKLEQLELEISNSSEYERNRTTIVARLDKEIAAADAIIASITEKPADKLSVLESVAVIEQIKSVPNAKLLYLLTVSQGGEVETSQATFRQGRVSYIGGVVVSFILTEKDGRYIASGNIQADRKASYKRREGANYLKTNTSSLD
ncbi:MAG: hypothetical protein MUE37_02205 [Bacteroidales bacterium]|jgi:hypothetical protein|nr:hypothetical protein [Bacteroidales bacterium]